jgi:hypothetical protein
MTHKYRIGIARRISGYSREINPDRRKELDLEDET